LIIFLFALVFAFSDFLVKKIVLQTLSYNQPRQVIEGIVYLRLVYNRGIAFGLFKDKTVIFTVLGAVFLLLFIFWLYKTRHKHRFRDKLFLSMVLGGGLNNLYDRIYFGYVIDYIDLTWWPVFNLSDSFITLGCVFFVISMFLEYAKNKKQNLSTKE
jgi:signal peptidase II